MVHESNTRFCVLLIWYDQILSPKCSVTVLIKVEISSIIHIMQLVDSGASVGYQYIRHSYVLFIFGESLEGHIPILISEYRVT